MEFLSNFDHRILVFLRTVVAMKWSEH